MASDSLKPKAISTYLGDSYSYEELAVVAARFDVQFAEITSAPRRAVADEIVRAAVRQRRLPELATYLEHHPGSATPDPVAASAPGGIPCGAIFFIVVALGLFILVMALIVVPTMVNFQ